MRTLDELTTMVGYQLETVMDFSPHCDAMNVIWNNVGGFICNGISMPAQGAWMACGTQAEMCKLLIFSHLRNCFIHRLPLDVQVHSLPEEL